MRHAKGPDYGSLLKRLRLGKHTRKDFETLNSRYIDRNDSNSSNYKELMKLQKEKNVSIPTACQANNSRHSINWLALKEIFYSIQTKQT